MGVKTMFPPSAQKPRSQYAVGANLALRKVGDKKTGFGPFTGANVAVSCRYPYLVGSNSNRR